MSSQSVPPGFVDAWAFEGEPTLSGPVPEGFHVTAVSRLVGHGQDDARIAGDAVLGWQVHRGSGFVPLQVPDRVQVGAISTWAIPFGPLRPRVACRVVRVLEDEPADEPVGEPEDESLPRATGFLHAALVGHPQRGWESYVVTHHPDDRVTLDIRVVWRPGAWWMRLAGPASGLALRLLLHRNLRALDPVLGR
ncbi:DUF1990 family protein [Frigoribacterium sp. PvP032]|uniref:DUF1990 family protein n=1 Tax=Frigoribacterium sp. PvP032 TaxID=2806589 RepID=UPI001AE71EB9|nr:DUF1990 family protein [Frigoribacterium sp. PvP032]MBP1190007.1 uncharacterized protein (UPF0548 family) [Frigoribacterium sp. PvP032]